MLSYIQKNNNRSKLKDILPVKMPLGLCIEPTNLCNFKCVQCPVSLDEFESVVGKRMNMKMELFKKIMADIKAMGRLNNLNLYGDGEPFLNKNILEMVRIAKRDDIAGAITITTNASLITEDTALEILDSKLDYLRVSVYSVLQERFAGITQTKLDNELIFRNIKYLSAKKKETKREKPFVYVKMLNAYSGENDLFISNYKNIADEVNIESPMNWNGYKGIDLISKIDPLRKTDETTLQGYYGKVSCSGKKRVCTTPFLTLNVKSNGDVVICIVDWNRGTIVGNIGRESLKDIWFGERLRKFREMHIRNRRAENPSCRNCRFLYGNPDNMDDLTEEQFQTILNCKP
ncbi:MAG: radical SAM/SPASM domain-containing protein [Chitinivibrionales bacterium]|nr:radical SAM/SPASM domain-containing protein [Chitinivibrionales bacterium]